MARVTIKDIAREAGVSISAVSLVLNNRPNRISAEKRAQILEIAKKNNYEPNAIARSMVTRESKTFGVIIPDLENIFFSSLVKVLESNCHKEGYMLLIVNSNDQLKREIALIEMLKARQIDGLFLVPSIESIIKQDEAADIYNNIGLPVVMLDRFVEDFECDRVAFDNELGAYLAVQHLIEQGHRQIGCVAMPAQKGNMRARMNGYMRAMHEHGLTIGDSYIVGGDLRMQSGYMAAQSLVSQTTAVFTSNDMMALGFLKYLGQKGIDVPDDYAVVGFDDVVTPYLINLELTSVLQDVTIIGSKACELMRERLAGSAGDYKSFLLQPELIVRESSVKLMRSS